MQLIAASTGIIAFINGLLHRIQLWKNIFQFLATDLIQYSCTIITLLKWAVLTCTLNLIPQCHLDILKKTPEPQILTWKFNFHKPNITQQSSYFLFIKFYGKHENFSSFEAKVIVYYLTKLTSSISRILI